MNGLSLFFLLFYAFDSYDLIVIAKTRLLKRECSLKIKL